MVTHYRSLYYQYWLLIHVFALRYLVSFLFHVSALRYLVCFLIRVFALRCLIGAFIMNIQIAYYVWKKRKGIYLYYQHLFIIHVYALLYLVNFFSSTCLHYAIQSVFSSTCVHYIVQSVILSCTLKLYMYDMWKKHTCIYIHV